MGLLWRLFTPTVEDRRIVLIYHAVGTGLDATREAAFALQLDWLLVNAKVMDLESLLLDEGGSGLRVALTFDDGYASVLQTAMPLMAKRGMTGTVYLNSDLISNSQRHLTDASEERFYRNEAFLLWDEVVKLASLGWLIGAHGAAHLDLTQVDNKTSQREIVACKTSIEDRLSMPCRHFSYTWGRWNPAIRKEISASGFIWSASGHHGPLIPGFDPLAFPRIDIRRDYTIEDFIAVVKGDWDWLGLLCKWRDR